MLAKTPDGRPASGQVVADRADMLRDALTLGGAVAVTGFAGATRGDLPAAPTDVLRAEDADPGRAGGGGPREASRRRLVAAGMTAGLCALAIAAGLYVSGHIAGPASGQVGSNNTVQHLSSSASKPSHSTMQHVTPTSSPSSTVEQPLTAAPSPVADPKPTKTPKPTTSPRPTRSSSPTASSSASSSPSAPVSPSSSSKTP